MLDDCFGMATHKGSYVGEDLESIFKQGTVISVIPELILLILGDSTFTTDPLLLFVDPVEVPHRNERQQHR